ncbi:hypothetical protein Pla108_38290 [Botrimarina colliarenosi]|uniref:Uncharacterized protein n=1 Tax=Botrimarina colliarenosi TaxID=2528001 RepID=A0A5C6A451_9BACT|nr:hypothetical protein Pla108_38290 [Botrimarina colliarenosi]
MIAADLANTQVWVTTTPIDMLACPKNLYQLL